MGFWRSKSRNYWGIGQIKLRLRLPQWLFHYTKLQTQFPGSRTPLGIFQYLFEVKSNLASTYGTLHLGYRRIVYLTFSIKKLTKKCLKLPKNNFKLGPKLIFEKKSTTGRTCENDKNLEITKNGKTFRIFFWQNVLKIT